MKTAVAQYMNSKGTFSKLIRAQQYLQKIPDPFRWDSHSEFIFYYTDDKQVLDLIDKIPYVYFGKKNILISWDQKIEYFKKYGLWFSSSERDGGTRFKFIEDSKRNWRYFDIEATKRQYTEALKYCIDNNEKPYGWASIIFTQVFKTLWLINRDSPFCSQIVTQILQINFSILIRRKKVYNAIEINPGRLAYILTKYFWNRGKWRT